MEWISYITKFFAIITEWNLTQHFIALKDFYIHPKRFWKKYNRLSRKDKICQFITYFVIFAIVALGCNGYGVNDIFKLVSPITQFAFIVIVLIGGYCLLYRNKAITISTILAYSGHYLFLIWPIIMIIAAAYRATGSYHILLLQTIMSVIMQLYLWVAPSIIFLPIRKERIFAIISIFIVLNIAEVTMYPFHKNTIGTNYPDFVSRERYELGKTIKNAYIIPYCVVTNKNNTDSFYLYSGPTDSIAWSVDTKQFFDDLEEDMDLLKTMSDKCEYEENKTFFSQLFEIRRGIVYCHQNRQYSDKITNETVIVDADGRELDRYTYRLFNEDIMEMNNQLLEKDVRSAEAYELALFPLNINMLMRPALMLAIQYDNKK